MPCKPSNPYRSSSQPTVHAGCLGQRQLHSSRGQGARQTKVLRNSMQCISRCATMCPLRDVSVLHNNCWANCKSNGSGPSSCRCLPELILTRCQPLVPSNGWWPSIHRMLICAQGQKAIHPIVPGKHRPSLTYLCMRHVQLAALCYRLIGCPIIQ